MTPAAYNCTQNCVFCWRAQTEDLRLNWDETVLSARDEPEEIVQKSIEAQEQILTGYPDNPKTDMQKYREALTPKHAAISLTGEPTLYEWLSDLIQVFHRRGLTTFLVSNGTVPLALKNLEEEPTQLYISVCGPDEKIYKQTCRPQTPNAWQKLNETLALIRSFKCPTALRITSVRGLNMKNPSGYARLIERANPTYVEVKSYMHVGFSRLRLGYDGMAAHEEIRIFSKELACETGYNLIDESTDSRVVLLSRLKQAVRFGNG